MVASEAKVVEMEAWEEACRAGQVVEMILMAEQQDGEKHGLDAAALEFLVSEQEVSLKQVRKEGMQQNYPEKC